jgi:hypothetical protein
MSKSENDYCYPSDDDGQSVWQQEWARYWHIDGRPILHRFKYVLRGTLCEIAVLSWAVYIPGRIGFSVDDSYPPEGGEIEYRVLNLHGDEDKELWGMIDSWEDEKIRYRALSGLDPNFN